MGMACSVLPKWRPWVLNDHFPPLFRTKLAGHGGQAVHKPSKYCLCSSCSCSLDTYGSLIPLFPANLPAGGSPAPLEPFPPRGLRTRSHRGAQRDALRRDRGSRDAAARLLGLGG